MNDLTRWRIREGDPCEAMAYVSVHGELRHERSCFVEDTTLQDIADAHQQALAVRDNPPEARRRYAERDALLDALGGTDKCGAWGGCILSKGHNRGRVDIPENHALEGTYK